MGQRTCLQGRAGLSIPTVDISQVIPDANFKVAPETVLLVSLPRILGPGGLRGGQYSRLMVPGSGAGTVKVKLQVKQRKQSWKCLMET